MAGLTREQIDQMTPKELREHVDALAGVEMAEQELLGEEEQSRMERKAKRQALLNRTRGRR